MHIFFFFQELRELTLYWLNLFWTTQVCGTALVAAVVDVFTDLRSSSSTSCDETVKALQHFQYNKGVPLLIYAGGCVVPVIKWYKFGIAWCNGASSPSWRYQRMCSDRDSNLDGRVLVSGAFVLFSRFYLFFHPFLCPRIDTAVTQAGRQTDLSINGFLMLPLLKNDAPPLPSPSL